MHCNRAVVTAAALIAISSGAWGFESSNDALDQEPKFVLSDQYPGDPGTASPGASPPWRAIEFDTEKGARDYLFAVLSYVIEGNENTFDPAAGGKDRPWRVEVDGETRWYHVPWMHSGAYGREGIHGLTRERDLRLTEVLPPEERPPADQDRRLQSWAVSFYNPLGGYTIGRVWPREAAVPEPSNARFEEHTVAAKLLFTVASEHDVPYLKGAPSWRANVHKIPEQCQVRSPHCEREVQTVRLIQLDVAVKDDRAAETGWVFGTFIFNGTRPPDGAGAIVPRKRLVDHDSVWNQIEPVGLMWGNDPGALSGADLRETVRTKDEVSAYQHLGCHDRLNGPVDNPMASCMACHALARFPAPKPSDNFPMRFPKCDGTSVGDDGGTAVSALYFRNPRGDQVIDDVDGVELPDDIELPKVSNLDKIKALDYSLQLSTGMANFCNFWKDQGYTQEIENFCQWDTEQVPDDQSVIADRTLPLKAALIPDMPRQSR